jgi:hypothetical protein
VRSLKGVGGILEFNLVHGILSIGKIGESLAPSGVWRPGKGQEKIFGKERETGE